MNGYEEEYKRGKREGIEIGKQLGYDQCKSDVLELLKRNQD